MMFEFSPRVIGSFIGALITIFLFSLPFRYALLGRSETGLRRFLVVLLTAAVAIGLSGFGGGSDGFWNRMTNLPSLVPVVSYSVAALIVGFVAWPSIAGKAAARPEPSISAASRWRGAALVLVIPMMLIGLGNLAGSVYSVAVHGIPDPVLGVSRSQMRTIMKNGDLGTFWRMLDERAPEDFDRIIERIFENRDRYRDAEDGRRHLDEELVDYRLSLAVYGRALTDMQRKKILVSNLMLLKAFEDRPELCVNVTMTGGRGLNQQQISSAKEELNHTLIAMTENLIRARQANSGNIQAHEPISEDHFVALAEELIESGMPEEQLQAVIDEDLSHPEYCAATIRFLGVVVDLDGRAGEAIRSELTQALLADSP